MLKGLNGLIGLLMLNGLNGLVGLLMLNGLFIFDGLYQSLCFLMSLPPLLITQFCNLHRLALRHSGFLKRRLYAFSYISRAMLN